MPRKPANLSRKIKDILRHTEALPPEAETPILHYWRSGIDLETLLDDAREAFNQFASPLTRAEARRHLARLRGMVLVNLVETFERFLKEAAAACIDYLGAFVLDDRFDGFRVQGSALAVHFGTDTLGMALCESSTWLDTPDINKRFRDLLADPFEQGQFVLLPSGRKDTPDRERYETLELVWQLRHTVVHNVGVVTRSDAVKFRLLAREAVASPRFLVPTKDDIRYLKRFLDETAEGCNGRVGRRLAELLTALHAADPTLFVPQEVADRLTATFGFALNVAGAEGTLPPL